MEFSPNLRQGIRKQVFSYDEATKIYWSIELFHAAPQGTRVEYSPDMMALLERLHQWVDDTTPAESKDSTDSTEFIEVPDWPSRA